MATRPPATCAVIGLGVMGSMTLLALARAGVDCVGYDMWEPGHPHGASGGGETRIFRSVSTDGPAGTRLLGRSRELWQDLDRGLRTRRGRGVFDPCGALTVGPARSGHVRATAGTTGPGDPAVEVLGPAAAAERWPAHVLGPDDLAVLDRRGGLLSAGCSVRRAVEVARGLGADVRGGSPVRALLRTGDRTVVRTDGDDRAVDSVVIASGRWLPGFGVPFSDRVEHRRVVLSWLGVDQPEAFRSGAFPPGQRTGPGDPFSFFPSVDGSTIKVNVQLPQPTVPDPDQLHPPVPADYAAHWAPRLRRLLHGVGAGTPRMESYVEGYTPRRRGVVSVLDDGPRTVALGGFSGRGFKYAPAVGEVAAALALGTDPAAADHFAG